MQFSGSIPKFYQKAKVSLENLWNKKKRKKMTGFLEFKLIFAGFLCTEGNKKRKKEKRKVMSVCVCFSGTC